MRLSQILELLAEDSRLNVYAGELKVRPPGAPTTRAGRSWTVAKAPTGGPRQKARADRSSRPSRRVCVGALPREQRPWPILLAAQCFDRVDA